MKIRARVRSDDYRYECEFDAAPWFEQASEEEIQELADCGWGGDYGADAVALYFEDNNPEIAKLMEYCRSTQDSYSALGFECYVNREAAMEWLVDNGWACKWYKTEKEV